MTTKRKWNAIGNLIGFTKLRVKKRKVAKKKEESDEEESGKENENMHSEPTQAAVSMSENTSGGSILDTLREPRQFLCEVRLSNLPSFVSAASILVAEKDKETIPDCPQATQQASSGPIDDSDSAQDDGNPKAKRKGVFRPAPSLEEVEAALRDLDDILKPPRKDKSQSYQCGLDKRSQARLLEMQVFCRCYVKHKTEQLADPSKGKNAWTLASMETAKLFGHTKKGSHKPGRRRAGQLRDWVHSFIDDREEVPVCDWKTSGRSLIDDPDFAQKIHAHLQSLKPHEICAEAIVKFLDNPEMLARLSRSKTISIETARRWLHKMGYRWGYDPKGQYVDGHEREDVVDYRNKTFLPTMAEIYGRATKWTAKDGIQQDPPEGTRRTIIWYHDESTFYANDRRRKRWVHKKEKATPYAKGEGHSLMAADLFSAEYGWLRSRDGSLSARVLFRAGKGRDGYFDNNAVRRQLETAMEIVRQEYPDEDHVFVFDNARTHSKRPEGSQTVLGMTKGPSAKFMVEVNELGEDGKPQYGLDGKILKKKVPMANGKFHDGTEQAFYWRADSDHPLAGHFKGMVQILEERGYQNMASKKAQCGKKFTDCDPKKTHCCCRRILYNEPDFQDVDSILETDAKERGYRVVFLPKFHCELNPIEQCWGYAKRRYRLRPPSSSEEDLKKNVVECLDEIPLITMRRFANRSLRFMDAYRRGLNGNQAAWAARKYKGHRTIPETILRDLEKANVS